MIDLVGFVLGVSQQFLEFGHVLPGFSKVKRTKIFIKAVIDKILVEGNTTLSILK